jgi:hypothetical protein
MNLKTTLVLAILVAVGGIAFGVVWFLQSSSASNETLHVLANELKPENLTHIEVRRGDHQVTLEKAGGSWALPGNWPVRQAEVDQLVQTLTSLHSRFKPVPLGEPPALKNYGLEGKPLTVKVRAGGKDYQLAFGEKPEGAQRFSSPTFVRLNDRPEVVRLAPGLIAALDRPEDYYMQRRLFPDTERQLSEGEIAETTELLAARSLEFKSKDNDFTLSHGKDAWELRQPVRDRPDPDKLKAILTAIPDLWNEGFKDSQDKSLDAFGLDKPEQTLKVTRTNGETLVLLVGKTSRTDVRKVQKPGMPDGSPFPPKPRTEIVHVEHRYAKLQNNNRIFEIKADRLKDLNVATDVLRDAQLARFKPDEVTRMVIHEGGRELVFTKEKERWKLEKPAFSAETSKVTELLDKLSGLQAREKDVIDKADPKKYGLDKPATITLTVVPAPKDKSSEESKTTSSKEITFELGSTNAENNQLYVQLAGWPRVNAVNADVMKLVRQPALAYRGRRVLDFSSSDLAKIEVKPAKGEPFTVQQDKGKWRLAAPVSADIDSFKAEQLAGDLSRLEATEFIAAESKKDDLEKVYGLEKPALSITAVFSDANKPAQTLLVGQKRAGKDDYYARLASEPAVFLVSKETHTTLDKDSLAYRSLELWQLQPEDITELRIQKTGPEYRLDRTGETWKLSGPFDATAAVDLVTPIVKDLATLKAERFTANKAGDLGTYGLDKDKPHLRVILKSKKESAEKTDKKTSTEEHELLLGKSVGKDGRYARLAGGDAIFVVADKVAAAVDHEALDLLDPKLLSVSPETIRRVQTSSGDAKLTLAKEEKQWRVTGSPAPPFAADQIAITELLRACSNLRASKFAAYGDKIDLAKFGLDMPATTTTVTLQPTGEKAKPVEHTLVLGKPVEGSAGQRYARLDKGPGVVVLGADTVKTVSRTYLDYVNHTVFEFNPSQVTGLVRQGDSEALEVVRRGDKWQLLKPADLAADTPTLETLCGELSGLRAERVAAYPARDLQGMGLDKPAAVLKIRRNDDKAKPVEQVLRIGKVADPQSGSRFARADNAETVIVLPGKLSQQLVAAPLQFRDRNLARVMGVDQVAIQRGSRKATFALADGTWKMTEPLSADAESSDLETFLSGLRPLRADELVADKGGDLKSYGLHRPTARWRFLQNSKELLTLEVGNTDKAKGGKAFARLGTSPLVFLLDGPTTARVLAEYRSRKVWGISAPDAAQVEKIRYGYAKDPFVLQKVDKDWQVSGKPMTKIKADAVRDVLDALASLQAERYVADRAEELKLYGLEPPVLTLELETPTGKKALHVGRQEGNSQRHYALVPGENAAVFLLSEADARRIVRPLEAFVETSKGAPKNK